MSLVNKNREMFGRFAVVLMRELEKKQYMESDEYKRIRDEAVVKEQQKWSTERR